MEFITPAGDPVAQPKDAGDGQNEFTFNSAKPGILEINLKVKVPGIGGMPADIQNKFLFEIDTIGNSQMQWDAANPGGKPTFNGDFMTAKVKFTGLPQNNSDFGKKMARIKFDGGKVGEEDFEVFFPKKATNHPGPNSGTNPNWFYYWLQTVTLLGSDPDIGYDPNGSYYDPNINKMFLSPGDSTSYVAPHGKNNPLEGIDNFAWTARHESQHYKDWEDYWDVENQGIAKWQQAFQKEGPNDNKDDDYLPNRVEDLNLNKIFDQGDRYDWAATLTPGAPAGIVNDAEDYTCIRHGGVKGDHSKDWSDPGMQHQTNKKYDD